MMSAPASANARAMVWPMPRVPPVHSAVFPLRLNKLEDIFSFNSVRRLVRG